MNHLESSEITHHYFETGGCRLHYVEAGQGPLVILYHGFPLFWFSFHHQIGVLKANFKVVALDGPGINLSSKPDDLELFKLPNLTLQIDELARHLTGEEKFSLVGHDWGGGLAWTFAQAYPHRLHKVVGINAPPTNQLLSLLETNEEQQKRSAYMWQMREGMQHKLITENGGHRLWKNAYAGLRKLSHFTDAHDEMFREALAQPGAVDGGINWYRANIPQLGEIEEGSYWPARDTETNVPGLLIWGETDTTFVPEFIDDLPRFVPNLTVRRIPGVGHTPMLEAPERTNQILADFLSGRG